eukprot:NODE_15_length_5604_cov_33.229703_g12_i0.p1 GENE.NODE_15_length_5604_cov_33.229703_g12_i0~~NODE_15_length_5604_cov_33.229703_g12_i0.p1  ORF type:complete len:1252 (+),score=269.04 NODE_15_length_5604_cov_33.229703_g12_i0:1571-5326(+)
MKRKKKAPKVQMTPVDVKKERRKKEKEKEKEKERREKDKERKEKRRLLSRIDRRAERERERQAKESSSADAAPPPPEADPNEPPKPSPREVLYLENPQYMQPVAENISHVMKIHSSTMHANIKTKCLSVLARIIHYFPQVILREALRNVTLSGFLATLLHSGDLNALAAALHMSQCLMDKLPEIYKSLFIREGVINEINNLSTRHEVAINKGGSQSTVIQQLINGAKQFASTYFSTPVGLDPSDVLCSEVARRLNCIAQNLMEYTKLSGDQQDALLRDLCSILASEENVSTYEVITSNIIESLLYYLTNKNVDSHERMERAGRLMSVLGRSVVVASPTVGGLAASFQQSQIEVGRNNYLQVLVQKLQSALSQEETFPVYVNDYAENNMTSSTLNCLKMLMQSFKLTLVHGKASPDATTDSPSSSQEEARGTTVMVEPLATVGAVEDFILSKLLSGGEVSSIMRPQNDEDEQQDEFGEETETTEIPPPSQKEEEEASEEPRNARTERRKDKNKEREDPIRRQSSRNEQEASSSVFTPEKKKSEETAQPKLVLKMGNNVLQSGMTIFQCIHKFGNWRSPSEKQNPDSAAHLTSRRMWEMVHVILYYDVDPNASVSSPTSPEKKETKTPTSGSPKRELNSESLGTYLGMITEGVVAVERSMDDQLEGLTTELGKGLTRSTISILILLRTLHSINCNYASIIDFLQAVDEERDTTKTSKVINFYPLSEAEFVSSKLTNKLLCQVHDPLLLCSGYLSSSWCQALAIECPFLFSFSTRRTFFELSSFGATRAMLTLQDRFQEQGEAVQFRFGRVQKQKIRLSRAHILESAMKVMTLYGSQRAFLEFEFFGEVGTGLGPTLEFYTLVSKALQASKLGMWRNEAEPKKDESNPDDAPPAPSPLKQQHLIVVEKADSSTNDPMEVDEKVLEEEEDYVFCPNGLFPSPINPDSPPDADVLRLFSFLGQFMGRAMVDKRIIDIPLSVPFLKMLRAQPLCLDDIKVIRPELHAFLVKSLALVRQKKKLEQLAGKESPETIKMKINQLNELDGASFEDLCIDFTLPGYSKILLKPHGEELSVNIWNLEDYVDRVVQVMLNTSIASQMAAFREGFNSIFPIRQMQLFNILELDEMFCGSTQPITMEQLESYTICDHGYTSSSRAIRFLFNVICSMTQQECRKFVLFVTGAPRLPVGGLKNLKPPLTIVRKTPDPSFDVPWKVADALPSVMTCANYLKLPDYASEETMREKLYMAMMEGQASFHLS